MLYRFAGFAFESDRHELTTPDGTTVELQAKVEGVLLALLDSPGRTVSKDELLDRVWNDVNITEGSLTRAIFLARRAFGDQEIIRTVRGRGYRIDVPIEHIDVPTERIDVPVGIAPGADAPAAAGAARAAKSQGGAAPDRAGWRRRTGVRIAALGSVLAGLLVFLGRPVPIDEPDRPVPPKGPGPPTALAVLRFADLGGAAEEAYLAEGISQELLGRLARVPGLRVVGSTSSFPLSDRESSTAGIGRRLGVGSVVTGSLRRDGQRLRVNAQLVRAADGFHQWVGAFDLEMADVITLQDTLAGAISAALVEAITSADPLRATRSHRPLPASYDHFLRGMYAQNRRSRDSADRAIAHFERAIALDPRFADAHAELARSLAMFAFYVRDDTEHWSALLDRADEMATRAVALDPDSGPAHAALAGLHRRHQDFVACERELRRAVALAPGYVAAREELAMTLAKLGRLDEARDEILKVVENDPLSPLAHRQVGRIYLYLGEPDRALFHVARALELEPRDDDAPRLLSNIYWEQDRPLEAGEVFIRRYPWLLRGPARVLLRLTGMRTMARLHYEVLRIRSGEACLGRPYDAAGHLAAIGDVEAMFDCLEQAPVANLSYFNVEPLYAPYREDPRFIELCRRAGRPVPATVGSRRRAGSEVVATGG